MLFCTGRAGSRSASTWTIVRPRLEANWEATPDMLPAGWERMDRREKADFILNGRTIAGGPPDMRYFFYEFRVDQIARFVREAHGRARRINPKIQMTAAVFKNPIQSGRYLGPEMVRLEPLDRYLHAHELSQSFSG